jgi:RNA polymerase sigma factor for flagellar operon FliA
MTYSRAGTTGFTEEEKAKIVQEYLPQIKIWAMRAKNTLPDSVDIDEIYSAASLGLIESLNKFDKTRKTAFATYVEHRVKGAIRDALRGLDFLSRGARTKVKTLENTRQMLSQKLGHMPTVAEIAEYSDTSEEELYKVSDLQNSDRFIRLDETMGDEDGMSLIEFIQSQGLTPEEEYMKVRLTETLAGEIDRLSEKERFVISLYYYEELTMKEIAQVLEITESRVSQLHLSAVQKMKKRLKGVI